MIPVLTGEARGSKPRVLAASFKDLSNERPCALRQAPGERIVIKVCYAARQRRAGITRSASNQDN